MITVENFYWVLYNTLLKPIDLDCRYFFPFGTTVNLSEFEYSRDFRRNKSHVLFHFDQESIYEESHEAIYFGSRGNYLTSARILANSEHSAIKKRFCRDYQLLDWYFFYHGFAALYWYQDMVYLDDDPGFTHAFLSFNHLVRNRRAYRMALTARLIEKDLLAKGLVSFHGTVQDCAKEITDYRTPLGANDRALIARHLLGASLPMQVDSANVDSTFSARMGVNERWWRSKGLFHLVNETVFYDRKLHLTEKIFQPIVLSRPFIMVAAPGNLAWLKSYGFKTFDRWIDETYDTIEDDEDRLDAIALLLERISQLPRARLVQMWQDMRETCLYNKRHFFGDFRRRIVDEMVDNFDVCCRIWNNGRVDGRELPRHPDLDQAKAILLR